MNENKRNVSGRFNIMDLFIILTIMAVAAGAFLKMGLADKIDLSKGEETDIIVYIRVEHIRPAVLEYIKTGDTVWTNDTGKIIGEIESIETQDAVYHITLIDGTQVIDSTDVRIDLTIGVKCKARYNDDGWYVGNRFMTERFSFVFWTNKSRSEGYIIKIDKIE